MKKFWNWVANNIISIISFLWPFILMGFSYLAGVFNEGFSTLNIILLIAIVLQLFITIIIIICNRSSYKSYYYPKSEIKSTFEVLEKEISYVRDKNDNLFFSRKLKIKSLVSDLHVIVDKFIWTGSQKADIPLPEKNIEDIREAKQRIGIWRFYDIVLNQHLKKGEELEIKYRWPVIKDCSSSSAFVSSATEEPTKHLKFNIELGSEYAKKDLIFEEYRSVDGNVPLNTIPNQFDDKGSFECNIDKKKIRRFRYYIIRWKWLDNKPNGKEK